VAVALQLEATQLLPRLLPLAVVLAVVEMVDRVVELMVAPNRVHRVVVELLIKVMQVVIPLMTIQTLSGTAPGSLIMLTVKPLLLVVVALALQVLTQLWVILVLEVTAFRLLLLDLLSLVQVAAVAAVHQMVAAAVTRLTLVEVVKIPPEDLALLFCATPPAAVLATLAVD
jgi:hypothetical protein